MDYAEYLKHRESLAAEQRKQGIPSQYDPNFILLEYERWVWSGTSWVVVKDLKSPHRWAWCVVRKEKVIGVDGVYYGDIDVYPNGHWYYSIKAGKNRG